MGKLQFHAIEFLSGSCWSLGKIHELQFSVDGNLILSNALSSEVVWESHTQGSLLAMQADGNLVIYDEQRTPVWDSDTAGNEGAFLQAGDDGTLEVVSDKNKVLWRAAPSPAPSSFADGALKKDLRRDPGFLQPTESSGILFEE